MIYMPLNLDYCCWSCHDLLTCHYCLYMFCISVMSAAVFIRSLLFSYGVLFLENLVPIQS